MAEATDSTVREEDAVGYISYSWKGAPSGVIDANAGGTALLGIDEAIRYFNRRQAKELVGLDYQIPVKTGEGSWIAWVLGVIAAPAAIFASAYAKKAGEKMADRDFAEIGFKDIAKKSVDALERLIELIKHTQRTQDWNLEKVAWKDNSTLVGIYNDSGDILYIPTEYVRWFLEMPKSALKKIATPLETGRSMTIGVRVENGGYRTVSVEKSDVGPLLEAPKVDDDDFLFPELEHGEDVVLEGLITRGNQETNTLGFQYKDHILNCMPNMGNIRRFKQAIFLHCRVHAAVNRHTASHVQLDRRPTLMIEQVQILEDDSPAQTSLFD